MTDQGIQYTSEEYITELKLYEFANGELAPLKYIKFRNDQTFFVITINKIAKVSESPLPGEFWFLSEDLAKAEAVKY